MVYDPETMVCPECGEECERESVDVGVGYLFGPWGCMRCGWSEDERISHHPDWRVSPTGMYQPDGNPPPDPWPWDDFGDFSIDDLGSNIESQDQESAA